MLTNFELKEIKKSIVNENQLILENSGEIIKLSEEVNLNINCYAYSLGIMKPAEKYTPGFTTNKNYDEDSIEDFIQKICEDLENLDIKYRKFGINDEIKLDKKQYLIQAMVIPKNSGLYFRSDFHFSRISKNNICFSKPGWIWQPGIELVCTLDKFDNYEIVEVTSEHCTRKYIRVAYFAITEK